MTQFCRVLRAGILGVLLPVLVMSLSSPAMALENALAQPGATKSAIIEALSFSNTPLRAGAYTGITLTARNTGTDAWEPSLLAAHVVLLSGDEWLAEAIATDATSPSLIMPGQVVSLDASLLLPEIHVQDGIILAELMLDEHRLAESRQRVSLEQSLPESGEAVATGFDLNGESFPPTPLSLAEIQAGQAVDVVFAMDTSGSMSDEFNALCSRISTTVQDLKDRGITVTYRILGIAYTRSCTTETVTHVVPGGLVNHEEDWGPATSDLANGYTWQPGYVKLIIPISDEGPQDGDPCSDPGTDRGAITQAITDAKRANVRVSPILGTGYNACTQRLAQELADTTGGKLFFSTNPSQDIADGIIELIGGVVNNSFVTVSPVTIPINTPATVTVTIRDNNRQPAVNRRVRLTSSRGGLDTFAQPVGTTNQQGQFSTTVTSLKSGAALISAFDLTANQAVVGTAQIVFGTVAQVPGAKPRIVAIQSDSVLEGLYLQGIGRVPNTIRVTVDWMGGTPGTVEYSLNNQSLAVKNATGPITEHTVDFGKLQIGTNTLRITASNSVGTTIETRQFTGYQAPHWLTSNPTFKFGSAHPAYIEFEAKWPGAPLFKDASSDNWIFPGERTTLTVQTGIRLRLPIRGGEWEAAISRSAQPQGIRGRPTTFAQSIRVLGKDIAEIEGELVLGGIVTPTQGVAITKGTIGVAVKLTEIVLYEKSVLYTLSVFTPAGPVVYQGLVAVPPIRDAAKKLANFTIGLTPKFTAELQLLSFNDWKYGGRFGIGGDLDATVIFLGGVARAYAGLGLDGGFSQAVDYGPCLDGRAEGHAGYEVNVLAWERSYEAAVELYKATWGYCSALWFADPTRGWRVTPVIDEAWHIPRGDFNSDYTTLIGAPPAYFDQLDRLAGTAATDAAMADATVFVNVYENAKPSLAWAPDGGSGMLVWTHDDPSKPAGQSLEIAYATYNGSSWSPMAMITTDTYPDLGPKAARLSDGRFVVVWERINDPALAITAPFDATSWSKTDIMGAIYDPATATWTPPTRLHSTNSVLDYSPVVAANTSGSALVVWRHNAGNELIGTTAQPDSLRYARWDGSGWSEGTLVTNLMSSGTPSLAYSNNEGVVAWSQVITPTGVLTGTNQIFISSLQGNNWSAPQQVTSGPTDHSSPQAFYTPGHAAAVAWVESDAIAWRALPAGPITKSNIAQQLHEFRLATSPTGDLIAMWTEQDDIHLSLYDWSANLWSTPANLTLDADLETYLTPVFENSDTVRIGYANTHMIEETRSVTTSDGQVITYTAKVPQSTDLSLLSLSPFSNLAPESITVVPNQSRTTAMVGITVANRGYFAADNVAIQLYDGDPSLGGLLIDSTTLTQPLAAGMTQTVTMTHPIDPSGGVRTFWAVVDPNNAIKEADENDNLLSQRALGADLVMTSTIMRYATGSTGDVETILTNEGSAESATTTIRYYLQSTPATIAVTASLPPLAPGESITLQTPWEFTGLGAGEHKLKAVVNEEETDFSELLLDNNAYDFSVVVASDLAVDPLYFESQPGSNGSVVMKATVFNDGSVDAINVPVAFFRSDGALAVPVANTVIPFIPQGGSSEATGTWNSPPNQYSLMVVVDPEGTQTESQWHNNVASLVPGFQIVSQPDFVAIKPGEAIALSVMINSIGGFTMPVTIESLDLPPKSLAKLTPSVVTPPGSASLEITVAPDTPPAIYPVRIVGNGGSLSSTATLNLAVSNLDAPTLVVTQEGANLTVSWHVVNEAIAYELQEQRNGSPWSTIYTGEDTSKTLTGKSGGLWCYQVRGVKNAELGPWSVAACATVGGVSTISGVIHDEYGMPMEGVTVALDTGTTTTSDVYGSYLFSNVSPGTYTISAEESIYYAFSPPAHTITVPPDATGVDFTGLLKTYSISGRVTEAGTGNPMVGVEVRSQFGDSAITDSTGYYDFPILAADTYVLTALEPGYAFSPSQRTVTLPPGVSMQDFVGTQQVGTYRLHLPIISAPSVSIALSNGSFENGADGISAKGHQR